MAHRSDVSTCKMVRTEFNRRRIDSSLTDIKVFSGVVYISGRVRAQHGEVNDTSGELKKIKRSLRSRAEIKDVVLEVSYV